MNVNTRQIRLALLLVFTAMTLIVGDVAPRASDIPVDISEASHIVMFEEDSDVDRLLEELESNYGVQTRFIYRYAIKGASMQIPSHYLADVSAHPGVKHVESDRKAELAAFPVDQEVQNWMERSGLGASHPFAEINGDDVETDVDIAIIDSGVNYDHPDLNVFSAADCVFDGITNACSEIDPTTATDRNGHGTRVAGLAAAKDNGIGIVGMAPGARIWAIRLIGDGPRGEAGGFDTPALNLQAVIAAIDWVTSKAADIEVLNMSLGISDSESAALRDAITTLVETGTAVFVSAGNAVEDVYGDDGVLGGGDDWEPAAFPEVATISGYTDLDGLSGGLAATTAFGETDDTFWESLTHPAGVFGSNFSTFADASNPVVSPGAAIDFAMPAVNIMSTCEPDPLVGVGSVVADCIAHDDGVGGNYGRDTGTSFAAPQAAGLAALMIARNGSSEFDGVGVVDEDDTYALRQALIDLAVAQDNANFGLVQPSPGDPDSNPDPLGSAGMMLNFDVTTFSLADTGSAQLVTVDTPYVPVAMPDTVQINLIHDSSKFTIESPVCGGAYLGGTTIGPTPNSDGTVIGCFLVGGPVADSGSVFTFDVVAANNGTQSFTLGGSMAEGSGFIDSGVLLMNANSPSFDITFSSDISGSFDLQAVSTQPELTLIAPTATAIMALGAPTPDVIGQYDTNAGTFSISVSEPGDYDIRADASGYISRLHQTVTVGSDGSVTGLPLSTTTLHGGDVNGDGMVLGSDVSDWLGSFGTAPANRLDGFGNVVDIDGDGFVTARDLSVLISNIGLPSPGGVQDWAAP